jgi:hypothetical protein
LNKTVFLRCVAENQRRTYSFLIDNGWAYPYNENYKRKLEQGWIPTSQGRLLVDGKGAKRVAESILERWYATHAETKKD